MSIADRCAAAIERTGGIAERESTGELFPAEIQPRKSSAAESFGPLGGGISPEYTLYAPWNTAGGELSEGEIIGYCGAQYLVLRVETLRLSGEPVYHWAELRRVLPEEEWNNGNSD